MIERRTERGINHSNGACRPDGRQLEITGNSADGDGAGILNQTGLLTITDSTISGNAATYEGGGIFVDNSALEISGSTISGNEADEEGGGIYVDDTTGAGETDVTIQDSTFSGNTSSVRGRRDLPGQYRRRGGGRAQHLVR